MANICRSHAHLSNKSLPPRFGKVTATQTSKNKQHRMTNTRLLFKNKASDRISLTESWAHSRISMCVIPTQQRTSQQVGILQAPTYTRAKNEYNFHTWGVDQVFPRTLARSAAITDRRHMDEIVLTV